MSDRDYQNGRQERFQQPQRQRRQTQDTEFATEPGTFQHQQQQQKKKPQGDQKTPATRLDNE